MSIKRPRTVSCANLNANVGIRLSEQPSSSNGARNKAARASTSANQAANPSIPPNPQRQEVVFIIEPPPPPPSPQIPVMNGGGSPLHTNPMLPPAFLDDCYYCKKKIKEDRYMNGGLEAYCSPACREIFNRKMIAAGKRSPEPK